MHINNRINGWLLGFTLMAATLPYQIAVVILPSPTFLNELVALLGWSALIIAASRLVAPASFTPPLRSAMAAMGLLMAMVLVQTLSGQVLNGSTALHWLFFCGADSLCLLAGFRLAANGAAITWVDRLAIALVAGALMAFATELFQYFQLSAHPFFVSALNEAGRIYGNMRQPNHMATFLCMGMVSSGWLFYRKKLGLISTILLITTIAMGIILTSSRTGALSLILLIIVGMKLSWQKKKNFSWLLALLVFIPAFTWALVTLAQHQVYEFYGAERWMETIGNPVQNTGTRLELWKNSLNLLRENWLLGTGFGQFQFYYLLSNAPVEFPVAFNNAHLFPLQIAVEFGAPVAALFFGLLCTAIYLAGSAFRTTIGLIASLLAMPVLIHSMFEFPLWYLYFLLPTSFALGLFLGSAVPAGASKNNTLPTPPTTANKLQLLCAGLLPLLALVATSHYLALAAIYKPNGAGDTLTERRETADKAFIFRPWVINSMLTSALLESPTDDEARALLPEFDRAAIFHMDQLFLYRYALVLTIAGDIERAKRVTYALGLQQSPFIIKLKQYSENRSEKNFKVLSEFISAPTELKISAKDFPKNNQSQRFTN